MSTFDEFCTHYDLDADAPDSLEQYEKAYRKYQDTLEEYRWYQESHDALVVKARPPASRMHIKENPQLREEPGIEDKEGTGNIFSSGSPPLNASLMRGVVR